MVLKTKLFKELEKGLVLNFSEFLTSFYRFSPIFSVFIGLVPAQYPIQPFEPVGPVFKTVLWCYFELLEDVF